MMLDIQSYLDHHIQKKEVKKIHREYILSNGTKVSVDDYSVVGNDDAFYDKYGYDTALRRGTAFIQVNGKHMWLFGLPKFGYDTPTTGLKEEDQNVVWYFTEKENGECGHVGFVDLDHVVIGSKNVHIVLSLCEYEKDLEMYESVGEVRLEYAVRIARLLRGQAWNEGLKEYMLRERVILVLEALFNTHIVHYDAEGYRITAFVRDGIVMSPMVTDRLCSLYQLPMVHMVVACTEEEYIQSCQGFTQCDRDSEGAVIYKEVDGVVELFKLKHPVYVAKRAARELIKRRASKQQWQDRMQQLHVEVSERLLSELYHFYIWLLHTRCGYSADDIQDQFAILWKKFKECGSPILEDIVRDDRNVTVQVVGFVGIPGCGKSTLSKALECGLTKKGVVVTRVNQDEMCKNRKQFVARMEQLAREQKDGYVLVDKVNHTPFLRKDVELLFTKVTWVVFDSGAEDMVDVCMRRIQERGIYHPSLVYSYKAKDVLSRFHEEMRVPVGDNVCTLQMQEPVLDQLHRVCMFLKETMDLDFTIKSTKALPSILYWKIDLIDEKHVTLVYQPSKEESLALLPHFGKEIEVEVEYVLKTDRVHVASVRKTPFLEQHCKNMYPHITLWTAEGVKPFEANAVFTSPSAVREDVVLVFKGIVTVEVR